MNTTLYRKVNNKIRYYRIEILKTLFDDFLLLIEYGNIKYNKPTRIIKEYFSDINLAIGKYEVIFKKKVRRGYSH